MLKDDTTHIDVQAERGRLSCFAEIQEPTPNLDDEGTFGALAESIGGISMGEGLHDVEAYEYYAHFRALNSHKLVFGEVESDHAAEEHVIECVDCRLSEVYLD